MTNGMSTASGETYCDVEGLIHYLVGKFVDRYDLDEDDCLSEANWAYLKAYDTYEEERGTFIAWVSWNVQTALRKVLKQTNKRRKRFKRLTGEVEDCTPERFNVGVFLAEFSGEVGMVLGLILNTPEELLEIIEKKGGRANNVSSTIREYLRGIGWTCRKVSLVFSQAQKAQKEIALS